MAIDHTDKRRRIALAICAHVALFRDSLKTLVDLNDQVTSGGLTFADSDFENQTGLKHTNAAQVSTLLTNVESLDTYLKDNFIDDVFEAVRP